MDDETGIMIREATPADSPRLQAFVAGLSMATRASRFFVPLAELPPMLTRALEGSDPMHHFLVAQTIRVPGSGLSGSGSTAGQPVDDAAAGAAGGEGRIVALGQYARRPPPDPMCELAVVVADAWQGCGLGRQLMLRLLADAAHAGLQLALGDVLRQNRAMLRLARRLGFSLQRHPDDTTLVRIVRSVRDEETTGELLAA